MEHKKQIFRTYIQTFFFKRYNSAENMANIAGFSVNFCDYHFLSTLFAEIFIKQDYYFSTMIPSPVILDCGSNIGMAALYFKFLYPNARLQCFEPDIAAFACLQRNIRANQLTDVRCYNLAIAEKKGPVAFFYDRANPAALNMSTQRERMDADESRVEADVLSNYIHGDIDCLKLDIEGAEDKVLRELEQSKKIAHIRYMIVEYHHHILKDTDVLSESLSLLERNGFGYQLEGRSGRPLEIMQYQDILIFAYRKQGLRQAS